MPPQDQAPVKDADLEQMSMNRKEGDRYVVNHDEGLTTVDFDGHVSLAKKDGADMAKRMSDTRHASDHDQAERWGMSMAAVQWRVGRRRSATGPILLARLTIERRQATARLAEEEDHDCYNCLGYRGR
ncbi:hypothetical protein B296_00033821 [Ensete ventricosum]|uniref:Uncharacterized protein n=1 Tax=Ensete ventricosum TaxID=4639 RepID=A0A426YZC1_ENSVE|nr:hypothetical protein B296_00033821 [Ensete ventricosum]